MNSHEKPPQKSRRKRTLLVIAAIALLAAVAGTVILIIGRSQKNDRTGTPYTVDLYKSDPNRFAIYDPDDPSIFEDEAYLSLDRSIHVRRGGEEYVASETDSSAASRSEVFFIGYFDALAHGDTERYNSMFTDDYYETYDRQKDFSEQRVYDIHITLLDGLDDWSRVSYLVEYRISRNNGTFRRDIYSDSSRPLVFDLVWAGDTYMIDGMKYPSA